MTDASRYANYRSRRLPREKRTLPLSGDLEDDGRYYRCWNCGMTCKVDRDVSDDGARGNGTILDAAEVAPPPFGTFSTTIIMDDHFTLTENGPGTSPITTYRHNHYPYIDNGCPFCGTRNWK